MKCGFSKCDRPSACGLKAIPQGFVINVCREHFRELKGRDFGSDPADWKHYREQEALL